MGSGQNGQLTRDSIQGAYSKLPADGPQVINPALPDLGRSSSGNFGIYSQLLDACGDHGSARTDIEPISHWPHIYRVPSKEPSRAHSDVLSGPSHDLQADSGSKYDWARHGKSSNGTLGNMVLCTFRHHHRIHHTRRNPLCLLWLHQSIPSTPRHPRTNGEWT